jgi:hypothetical protein
MLAAQELSVGPTLSLSRWHIKSTHGVGFDSFNCSLCSTSSFKMCDCKESFHFILYKNVRVTFERESGSPCDVTRLGGVDLSLLRYFHFLKAQSGFTDTRDRVVKERIAFLDHSQIFESYSIDENLLRSG